jgi:putative endopeptidase
LSAHSRSPKFSTGYMDRTADPRKDFYHYAVGKWLKTHPLPPDKSWYGAFNELDERNLLLLKGIAERSARESRAHRADQVSTLVGDFYRSAMDVRRAAKSKFRSIEDLWSLGEGVQSAGDIAKAIPRLHSQGVEALFHSYSKADDKDSAVYAFYFDQGGLSLPDRDYYLSKDFAKLRTQYLVHMARMFSLKGVPKAKARRWASSVMRIETALARASRTRTQLRDIEKNYNRRDVPGLDAEFPRLTLAGFLKGAGVAPVSYVVVRQPEFFRAADRILAGEAVEALRAYLCWNVLHSAAPFLHSAVAEENFDFFRRKLSGQKKPEVRWKRSIRVIDAFVGEAIGKLFVQQYFPEEAKRRADTLIEDLRGVFTRRLESLPWMSQETREQALSKFRNFRTKIGHPPTFRDYSSIKMDPGDYAGNVRKAAAFEYRRLATRTGGPVDKEEWQMSPSTVNAYFEPSMNEIVFPAGILQPPFFDHKADDPVNYGAIGVVIGHEITHGYDDQGRKYDSKGNLREWWTPQDKKEFDRRARSIVKAYSANEILPGLHANGKLTLGENIADLGGVSIAFEALQARLSAPGARAKKDGLTPEQRFFISYGQIWREVAAEQEVRRLTTIDPHSIGRLRAVIPALNHPAFDGAFPPKRGEEPRQKVGVW